MNFWNSFPFVRFSIVLILGIISHDFLSCKWTNYVWLLSSLTFLYVIILYLAIKLGYYRLRHLTGTIGLFVIFFLGTTTTHFNYHSLPDDHYSHKSNITSFAGSIVSTAKKGERFNQYEFEVTGGLIDSSFHHLKGNILLYISGDSTTEIKYGDHLLVDGKIIGVTEPKNPAQFNYQQFLARKKIYGQAFVSYKKVKIKENQPKWALIRLASDINNYAQAALGRHVTNSRESGIIKALVLGVKDQLDDSLELSYASVGAMHILAVSGLHVGIIYLILQSTIGRIWPTANGRKVFGIVCIVIIWFYALITGLSPSVLRASTMFSVMAIGKMRSTEGNIYNTLGIAAFILLITDPYLIYSIGFQLSFIAVFGIVYLQPKICRLWNPSLIILDKVWAISSVSIAAQVATLPLSLFYFHQFPVYFLVTNLMVIPAATLILSFGLCLILFEATIPSLSPLIGFLLEKVTWITNESVVAIDSLPFGQMDWIYLNQTQSVLIYLSLILLFFAVDKSSYNYLKLLSICLLALIGWTFHSKWSYRNRNEVVFYQASGHLIFDHIRAFDVSMYVDNLDAVKKKRISSQINPHRLSTYLPPVGHSIAIEQSPKFKSLGPIKLGMVDSLKVLLIDSSTFHLKMNRVIATDILLIENESVKSLKWLIKNFRFHTLIIGNKNSNFYIRRMKSQASKLDLSIHSIKQDGAFIVKLDD